MRAMARTAGLLSVLSTFAASGCGGEEGGRGLTWEYGFAAGADPARAAFVSARILDGGCSGRTLYEEQIRVGVPPAGMLPPELPAGTYGFSIEARDEACTTFAAGCTEVRVPEDRRVRVPVTPVGETAACLPADCGGGRCPGPDASVCMPTAEVCNGSDDDCDAMADEGIDLTRDLANCGRCGNACTLPNARTECAGGVCTGAIVACDAGFEDCDGLASTGCEAHLESLTDCGGCGITCGPLPNATATCAGGTCAIASCNDGFDDCDGDELNGCETDVRTLTDCGECGVVCALPNAATTCATETCEIETCDAGFADCDGIESNGCEIHTDTNDENCGSCRSRCPGSQLCCDGTCETACMGGVCCPG